MTIESGKPAPIAIIGAGIVGAACAAFLQRDGHSVLLIDERAPGEGCSFGNAGALSPDMCIPAAMPGMLRKVPGWLTDPLGPLAIRPAYFPRVLPWLLRWIRAGRMDQVQRSSAALRALHKPVFDTYRILLDTNGFNDLIRMTGQLYLWTTETKSAAELISEELRRVQGVRSQWLDAGEIRQMEPGLAPGFVRGQYFPENGYTVNPQRLVRTIVEQVVRGGGRVERRKVTGFGRGDGRVTEVATDGGPIPVSGVVIAAGAWSHRLTAQLGCRIPLDTERGYHVMLPKPGITVRNKVSNRSRMFGLTPMEHGVRLSGTVELAGVDAPPDERRAQALLTVAKQMYPGLADEGMSIWMGCRPSLPDSVPVIDRVPGLPNAIMAFGHGHTGMTGGPTTGRLVADIVAGRDSSIDLSPYRATRF